MIEPVQPIKIVIDLNGSLLITVLLNNPVIKEIAKHLNVIIYRPHLVPNLNDFLVQNTKQDILKNIAAVHIHIKFTGLKTFFSHTHYVNG